MAGSVVVTAPVSILPMKVRESEEGTETVKSYQFPFWPTGRLKLVVEGGSVTGAAP